MRNGQAVFRTPALQHFFDCPLQFAAYPDYTSATDTPEDAGVYELPVQPGDMIVAGTDGLWDNVPQEEIIATLPNTGNGLPEVCVPVRRTSLPMCLKKEATCTESILSELAGCSEPGQAGQQACARQEVSVAIQPGGCEAGHRYPLDPAPRHS